MSHSLLLAAESTGIGQIRGVVLKVNHNGRSSTLRKPTQCLYPLEVAEQRVSDELLSKVTQDAKQDKSTVDTY